MQFLKTMLILRTMVLEKRHNLYAFTLGSILNTSKYDLFDILQAKSFGFAISMQV